MEEIYEKIEGEDCTTINGLSWKLLFCDDIEKYTNELFPNVIDSDIKNKIPGVNLTHGIYEKLADEFQILISLYMEMVFNILKVNHATKTNIDEIASSNSYAHDLSINSYAHDLSIVTMGDLINVFEDAFKKIKYMLHVSEIEHTDMNNPRDYGYTNMYYCRIILKDTYDGMQHFIRNANNIDPNVRYTFLIRNDTKKNYNNIRDFYAVCSLPKMKIKISFSKINVHF